MSHQYLTENICACCRRRIFYSEQKHIFLPYVYLKEKKDQRNKIPDSAKALYCTFVFETTYGGVTFDNAF